MPNQVISGSEAAASQLHSPFSPQGLTLSANQDLVRAIRLHSSFILYALPRICSNTVGKVKWVHMPSRALSNAVRRCADASMSCLTLADANADDGLDDGRDVNISRKASLSAKGPPLLSQKSHGSTHSEGIGPIVPGKSMMPVMLASSSTLARLLALLVPDQA